jgi:hypothetical protein
MALIHKADMFYFKLSLTRHELKFVTGSMYIDKCFTVEQWLKIVICTQLIRFAVQVWLRIGTFIFSTDTGNEYAAMGERCFGLGLFTQNKNFVAHKIRLHDTN